MGAHILTQIGGTNWRRTDTKDPDMYMNMHAIYPLPQDQLTSHVEPIIWSHPESGSLCTMYPHK